MARLAALLLVLAALSAGCRFDPEGRCDTRADCPEGLDCLAGVCAACREDGDCSGWEGCGIDGLCAALGGRCGDDADCASWDACDASHVCVLRPDHCADDTVCTETAYHRCDPAHHCSVLPGWCSADADCFAWAPTCDTATHRCQVGATAGDDVLAWGTLAEGSCDRGAVSRATTAAASSLASVEVGFDCGSGVDGRAYVDPAGGALVYRHAERAGGDTLRRFRPEAVAWDAAAALWRYPADPSEDDEIALVPAECPVAWDRWIMQAGTGALLYACPITPTLRTYYAAAGTPRLLAVREALSWSAADDLLVLAGSGELRVVTPAGVATTVTGLPGGMLLANRATATGFRLALHDDLSGVDELWEIDAVTAVATLAGSYVAPPDAYASDARAVLDSDGTLYGVSHLGTLDLVQARPLSSATWSERYSEASMPANSNDFGAATFKPFVRLQPGTGSLEPPFASILVTRP